MFIDVLLDALLDTVKLLPFLLLTYLALEALEHKAEEGSVNLVRKETKLGPLLGALVGVVPQCGFSAATANLYAAGVIGRGTLLAVFLSTSDEMLPILISERAPVLFIVKVLAFKCIAGAAAGLLTDLEDRRHARVRSKEIHELCEQEGCKCEDGIVVSALRHTAKIAVFLLLTSFVIGFAVESIGEDRLAGFILNRPVIGELLAGLIGLIPNCAASVIITKLYLSGGMSAGAMLTGLLVGAGVGPLVLCRMNRNLKENITVLLLLYGCGVLLGLLGGLLPIW